MLNSKQATVVQCLKNHYYTPVCDQSCGYTCDVYLHWQHKTSFYIVEIVKPECCTCSQGQVLEQHHWDNVVEYSSN